jgi:hypothetical protein
MRARGKTFVLLVTRPEKSKDLDWILPLARSRSLSLVDEEHRFEGAASSLLTQSILLLKGNIDEWIDLRWMKDRLCWRGARGREENPYPSGQIKIGIDAKKQRQEELTSCARHRANNHRGENKRRHSDEMQGKRVFAETLMIFAVPGD